jgi:hypothetical protein
MSGIDRVVACDVRHATSIAQRPLHMALVLNIHNFCNMHTECIYINIQIHFEIRCWRKLEKISWTDGVGNEKVLQSVKEERNILHTVKRKWANWIGHILCRNCLLGHVIQRKI